jgi:hypothetical protein
MNVIPGMPHCLASLVLAAHAGSTCLAAVEVTSQHLDVTLDVAESKATVSATLAVTGDGPLTFRLREAAEISAMTLGDESIRYERAGGDDGETVTVTIPAGGAESMRLNVTYAAVFREDVAAGERPGQIHNFAVDAHVGPDGVFLADGSAWHPLPIGADGETALHVVSVDVAPIEGWAFVASGDPFEHTGDINDPVRRWRTPRPVDGLSLVGNRHMMHGRTHDTNWGPVEVVMHLPAENARFADMFVEAACDYLDLYVPKLGPFPYKRFSIVENFFSSGFAFPGFTVLGPRVVRMAPRSLAPGYLDHELVHNWWGNGVYVDPKDGNWCEGLTAYCTNYYRRIFDEGEEAGLAYRRGVLMRLSSDPETLDDAALGTFGSADPDVAGASRFVGYDKCAFVFSMLEDILVRYQGRSAIWRCLRRFAADNMGKRASWSDFEQAVDWEFPRAAEGFFELWVRDHTVPVTYRGQPWRVAERFSRQFSKARFQVPDALHASDGTWVEIDPEFRYYRVLPPEQIIPTIDGTLGRGGVRVVTEEDRGEMRAIMGQLEPTDDAENLLIIGHAATTPHTALLLSSTDPVVIGPTSFTVEGTIYDKPTQTLLHTIQHPEKPGRFITIFHANSDAGWSRLPLIRFYSRDTTIIWDGDHVAERRVYEPERRIELGMPGAGTGTGG